MTTRSSSLWRRRGAPPAGRPVRAATGTRLRRPLMLSRVAAGFPSPAEDYVDAELDLNEYLIQHPAATFFLRVSGESMTGAGIHPGDILIVDRALTPVPGRVVIAVVNGELTVKRLKKHLGQLQLAPENPDFPATPLNPETDFEVWGVVTSVIHKV